MQRKREARPAVGSKRATVRKHNQIVPQEPDERGYWAFGLVMAAAMACVALIEAWKAVAA